MQIIIQAACQDGPSLREAIVRDRKLEDYYLQVSKQKSAGRNPGWAKLHSTDYAIPGAINMTWDAASKILLSRVIARESNIPSDLAGDFVAYLLKRHKRRIKAINILTT
ncbi:MAG TPA: hypothetical protein VFD58_27035 [Blastocatellia bacterium]|nr:hypothetical protein [Blastocatellia bacterium]